MKAAIFKRATFYLWVGLAFWVMMLMGDLSDGGGSFGLKLLNEVWRGLYIIALNFFFFEYVVPRVTGRRIFRSILLVAGSILLYIFGLFIWRCIGIGAHIYTTFPTDGTMRAQFSDQSSTSVASFFFFGVIRHIYDHIKLRRTAQQLRIEKQAAELNYLKSQTNPHFLFNTLNNIYSLARDKSDLAPESVLRLSKILRFMLYETGGEFIAIEQELKIISDYIALEQLRYDDTLRVNFNYDIEDMKQAIPPLLLIPLVENAFKHGASETRNQPFVDIHLSVNQRRLTFLVKNSTEASALEVKENIGLSNLRRQLELLYTDFGLVVQQAGAVFTASLKINLASHV
jgi:two-component system, LytTR family, sensor kinase